MPAWIQAFIAEHGLDDTSSIPSPMRAKPGVPGTRTPIGTVPNAETKVVGCGRSPEAVSSQPRPLHRWAPSTAAVAAHERAMRHPLLPWEQVTLLGEFVFPYSI
jgi:hypothetical protein